MSNKPPTGTRPTPTLTSRGATVRLGPLAKIPDLLRILGYAPESVLPGLGYELGFFEDPELPVSYVAASALLARCVEWTGCEHFGLRLGEGADPTALGLAGFVLMNAPDVGTALRDLVCFLDLHDRGGIATLKTSGDTTLLGFLIVEPGVEALEQVHDLSIAVACNVMRSLCGPAWNPAKVLLPHRKPDDARPWKAFFRSPVHFDAGQSAMAFPSSWLRKPVAAANPALHRLLERQAAALRSQAGSGFVAEVQRVAHGLIAHGACSATRVAAMLGLHERALNRRLQAAGTTFMKLRDAALYDKSRQLLGFSGMNLAEVAEALGYADATTFIRAFHRWSGQTPAQWRREQSHWQTAADRRKPGQPSGATALALGRGPTC